MRYFALYHDRTRLHDVDVMSEEQIVDLSAHYGNKVAQNTLTDEDINDSLDYLLKVEACVRIEELMKNKDDDREVNEYYLKNKEEVK